MGKKWFGIANLVYRPLEGIIDQGTQRAYEVAA